MFCISLLGDKNMVETRLFFSPLIFQGCFLKLHDALKASFFYHKVWSVHISSTHLYVPSAAGISHSNESVWAAASSVDRDRAAQSCLVSRALTAGDLLSERMAGTVLAGALTAPSSRRDHRVWRWHTVCSALKSDRNTPTLSPKLNIYCYRTFIYSSMGKVG